MQFNTSFKCFEFILIRYSCSCRISLNNLKTIIPGRKYILRPEKPLLKCLLQDSLVVDLNNTYPTELLRSLNKLMCTLRYNTRNTITVI